MGLTRETLEGDVTPIIKAVFVPQLGDTAHVRDMTALARDAYDNSLYDDDGKRRPENLSARLVARCLCDEEGVLLYPNAEEGARIIAEWPTWLVEPLFIAARKLNLMGRQDLEEAAKNSENVPPGSSNTD